MNILLPVISGSEVRQFFLSGIASSLTDLGHIVYVIIKLDNKKLKNEIELIDARFIVLPHLQQRIEKSKFAYLHSIIDLWYDSINKRWSYSVNTKLNPNKQFVLKLFKYILNFEYFNKFALNIEKRWMNQIKVNAIYNLLEINRINKLVVSTARFLYYPELLIACHKLNIPVDVVYHSNKELFAQPRLFFDFNRFGVWDHEMQLQFIKKYPELQNKVEIIGSSHFSYLKKNKTLTKIDFYNTFKIENEDCLIILYTAASTIIKNEYLIVNWIKNFLKERDLEFKIIVRKNPMDTTDDWDEYFKNESNVVVQHPKWVMDWKLGLHYTLQEDLIEYTSLLSYSSLCINIPSTVTIEAAIMNTPVINICFDFPDVHVLSNNGKIREFWDAPFYKLFHNYDFIFPSFDINQLSTNLIELTSNIFSFKDYKQCEMSVINIDEIEQNKRIIDFIVNHNVL